MFGWFQENARPWPRTETAGAFRLLEQSNAAGPFTLLLGTSVQLFVVN
jgi:hypothetical protein